MPFILYYFSRRPTLSNTCEEYSENLVVNLGEASATYYNASTTTSSIRQSNGTPSHEVTISEDIGSPRQSNAVDLPEIANNRRTHECIFICCKCIYWRPKCCFFKPPKGCVEWLLFLWVVIGILGLFSWILFLIICASLNECFISKL